MPSLIPDPTRKLERMVERQNKRMGILDDAAIKRLQAKIANPRTLGGMVRPEKPHKPSAKKRRPQGVSDIMVNKSVRAKAIHVTHEQVQDAIDRFLESGGEIRRVEPEVVTGSLTVAFGGKYASSIMDGFHEEGVG